jgi:hypothetical protein
MTELFSDGLLIAFRNKVIERLSEKDPLIAYKLYQVSAFNKALNILDDECPYKAETIEDARIAQFACLYLIEHTH